MEPHLVAESVKFMILGMTVVFLFLYLLVLLMRLQAKLVARYFPVPPAPVKQRKFGGHPETDEEEKRRVAAIVAAVGEYRKAKRGRKNG